MGMTITEKILANHAEVSNLAAGDLINVKIDIVMGHDLSAPLAISELEKIGANSVFDKNKIVLVPDHFAPNKDIKSAENCRRMREFAKKFEISHYYEVGEMGISHVLLPEKGIVLPGDVIVGGDSHTCTYGGLGAFSTGVGSTDLAAAMLTGQLWFKVPESIKLVYHGKLAKWVSGKDLILYTIGDLGVDGALYKAMEFTGDVVTAMPISDRLTMANMAIEAGAKNGIFEFDAVTEEYLRNKTCKPYNEYHSDLDASYVEEKHYDVGLIEPQVAFPHLPSNTKPISQVEDIYIDQVIIGSCTNGRIEDFRIAAEVLRGKKVARYVRMIIIPGSQEVYRQALVEGLIAIFLEAGAAISTPTCGPCVGGHMGVLAKGERAISTTNRNFVGRMGHLESEIYLSNPAVAAASSVTGKISSPDEV